MHVFIDGIRCLLFCNSTALRIIRELMGVSVLPKGSEPEPDCRFLHSTFDWRAAIRSKTVTICSVHCNNLPELIEIIE